MTTPKALLILHGKQALNEDVRAAVQARREQGWELAVRVTWEGGDAQRIVNEALADGYTHLIAGGGDGTLRDVAEAMALAKTDASLVLMPLGTANDFARAAGVPVEVSDDVRAALYAAAAVFRHEIPLPAPQRGLSLSERLRARCRQTDEQAAGHALDSWWRLRRRRQLRAALYRPCPG